MLSNTTLLLLGLLAVVLFASPAHAFGAGNIASVSAIEGHNWRHGDIEDILKTVICLRGHKWTSMMIKRVYFGNWLRDYSQAVDVGTLKGVQADTIRILVWVLAFMSFGYATEEFEVTADRLGCYRPEEHIDNPKDYAENKDAREADKRLRGPIMPVELEIDPDTGMKNYIANERGNWATSAGYIRWSFARSIHFGRVYTHGAQKGREEDLCEALRCLGQGLHCLEDFGAHTNYTELALRELGFKGVFPHVGADAEITLRGKRVYPLVTGTFGGVDFLHSVLGEATDHVTQSEVQKVDDALTAAASGTTGSQRGIEGGNDVSAFTDLLAQVPGTASLISEALELKAASDAQAQQNTRGVGGGSGYDQVYGGGYESSRAGPDSSSSGAARIGGISVPDVNPQEAVKKIYPLLAFRDKVVRNIAAIVSKIPGLEKMIENISERVTLFIMGLLAPYMKPIIAAASNGLKTGSSTVVSASAKQQYLVWEDPRSSDPTHSMLSKDHFSNVLNMPAGEIAAAILQYVAPRIVYGWDHPETPENEILDDVVNVFHHPAVRDERIEIHRTMFKVVERWVHSRDDRGSRLNDILSSQSVRAGKNHVVMKMEGLPPIPGSASHSAVAGGPLAMFGLSRSLDGAELQNTQGFDDSAGRYGRDEPPQGFGYGGGNGRGEYRQDYQGGEQYSSGGFGLESRPSGYQQESYGGGGSGSGGYQDTGYQSGGYGQQHYGGGGQGSYGEQGGYGQQSHQGGEYGGRNEGYRSNDDYNQSSYGGGYGQNQGGYNYR